VQRLHPFTMPDEGTPHTSSRKAAAGGASTLHGPSRTFLWQVIAGRIEVFERNYRSAIGVVARLRRRTIVCTIDNGALEQPRAATSALSSVCIVRSHSYRGTIAGWSIWPRFIMKTTLLASHEGYRLVRYESSGEARVEHPENGLCSLWLEAADVDAIRRDPSMMVRYALDLPLSSKDARP
jgi:hypothetical protein